MQVFYLILAICCYIGIAISYLKPKYMATLTWCMTIYITLRLSIRCIDGRMLNEEWSDDNRDEKTMEEY